MQQMIVNYSDLINQDYSDIEELEEWLDSLEEEDLAEETVIAPAKEEV